MGVVFADTGYWVALWNPRDALHQIATALSESLGESHVVTTQLVLVEVLDSMAGEPEFRRAFVAQRVQELEATPYVDIIPLTANQFGAALERYIARPDQQWSLTDCASFLVMEERGMTDALAHDRDFKQAGFAPPAQGQPYAIATHAPKPSGVSAAAACRTAPAGWSAASRGCAWPSRC